MAVAWVIVVFVGTITLRFLSVDALENDHFVSLARAHQVLHGASPVRDFFDPGQPLAYLTSAAAAALGGPSLLTEVLLAISLLAWAASLTFVLAARASGSVLVALAAAGLEFAAYPRLYNAAKLLIPLLGVRAAWRYTDEPSLARLAMLAVWTAVAFLWRHDFAVYLGGPAALLLFYQHSGSPSTLWRRLAAYICLSLVFVLPWLAYVQWAGGLADYFASASRFVWVEAQRTGRPDNVLLLVLVFMIPLVALGVARIGFDPTPPSRHQSIQFAHVVFVATLAMALDLVFLRDAIKTRLPDVVAPSVLLLAYIVGRIPRRFTRWVGAGVAACATLAVVALLMRQGYGVPTAAGVIRRFERVTSNLRRASPEAIPDRVLLPIVRYLATCTGERERVLVSGFAPQIPVLAGRAFAAGLPSWLDGYYTNDSDIERAAAFLSREAVSLAVLLDGSETFSRTWPRLAHDLKARGFVERVWQLDDRRVTVWLPPTRTGAELAPPTCTR